MSIEFDNIEAHEPSSSGGRRSVIAVVGAGMLIAAAGGIGFGIGRNVDRDDGLAAGAAQDADLTPTTEALAEPQPRATVEPVAPADEAPASTDVLTESDPVFASGDYDVRSAGGSWLPYFGSEPATLLFERTTESGMTARAHLGPQWEQPYYGEFEAGGWQPPGWCYESGQVRLALGGNNVIDVGAAAWYGEPYKGRNVSWVTMGRVDGAPHRVVFVQAPPEAASVTATFGDGAVDSVAPQNGVAVLVVAGEPTTIVHTEEGGYSWLEEIPNFVVTFDNGAEPVVVDDGGAGTWNDAEFQASCSPPPPPLPAPGEQPLDADAVETEIVDLMATIYGPDDGLFDTLSRIDDPTGIEAAREEVRQGSLEESAASAEAVVEELVFTTPTEAWFRYRIETINGIFSERYGIAVLVDDVWKITRDTICQDLALAGGSCGGGAGPIRPPGFEYVEDGNN